VTRCWCGRPVPAASYCGCCCAEHDHPEDERWEAVPGYEGRYEVSDRGRVRSIPQVKSLGRILRQHRRTGGYYGVSLYSEGRARVVCVHRLVMEAFVGPQPKGWHTRHLDGDQTNNRLSNLAYGTALDNADDVRRHGTHWQTRKTQCPRGHSYSDPAHLQTSGSERRCRTCHRVKEAERVARRVAAGLPRR
jgi:NUMOD4 motif/HNH endonuclease